MHFGVVIAVSTIYDRIIAHGLLIGKMAKIRMGGYADIVYIAFIKAK